MHKVALLPFSVCTIGYLCSNIEAAIAQVTPDNTLNTRVNQNGNVAEITGGETRGSNLFHSFQDFSVPTGNTADFINGTDISNIFSRVTGGNISNIDGLIRANGSANLFLINPAGIIFGANAQLDIGGSFVATTAESIIFADGTEFNTATTDEPPILTISSPIGLQYGDRSQIAVSPNSNREANSSNIGLSVRSGNTLALLGGDIAIARNSLSAIGSNVEISAIESGTVGLERADDSSWNFNYSMVREYGTIDLSDRALIDSSGIVNFRAKQIDFVTGSGIRNFTDVMGNKGSIELKASESIALDGGFLFTQVGQISSNLEQAIAGSGGDISIEAPKIFLTNGSVISAGTLSQGVGGNITLKASETIELSSTIQRSPSIISTSTIGTGDGGYIEIDTGRLEIYDGSQIQAFAGEGKGGTITVKATESIDLSGTGILRSQDNLGNITETTLNSGFTASSGFENLPFELQPAGESGNLIIDTPQLAIADSAQISVSNYGSSNAGDIRIATDNLSLDTAGKIAANTASGRGGSISITSRDLIVLDRGSTISTAAQRDGDGGNIFLQTDNLVLLDNNYIEADAKQGSGGNISISTQGLFVEPNSKITASSEVNTKTGTVEIITLDLSSRLHINREEYFPLATQNDIHTGCGANDSFAQNQFHNIGRGGISHNPIEEIASFDVLSDLGKNELDKEVLPSKVSSRSVERHPSDLEQSIFEADSWKVNSQGKIELVARHNSSVSHNSACQG